jgi:transposase
MAVKAMTLVGLDVHARQTHAAILDPVSGELRVSKLRMAPVEVASFLEGLGPAVRAVYEAGPTGFGLARVGREHGIDMRVVAPGSIPKGSGDRVKTDRRDAVRLVRLLAAGELSFAFVPTVTDEHFRDLVRAIEDVRGDLMRARHRVGKFLLRRDTRYPGPGHTWTNRHLAWLRARSFQDACSQATFADYLASVELLMARDAAGHTPGADPRVPSRARDRPLALLPRDRHAVGRRLVRRAGRLATLPQAGAAVGVSRDRAVRAHV